MGTRIARSKSMAMALRGGFICLWGRILGAVCLGLSQPCRVQPKRTRGLLCRECGRRICTPHHLPYHTLFLAVRKIQQSTAVVLSIACESGHTLSLRRLTSGTLCLPSSGSLRKHLSAQSRGGVSAWQTRSRARVVRRKLISQQTQTKRDKTVSYRDTKKRCVHSAHP